MTRQSQTASWLAAFATLALPAIASAADAAEPAAAPTVVPATPPVTGPLPGTLPPAVAPAAPARPEPEPVQLESEAPASLVQPSRRYALPIAVQPPTGAAQTPQPQDEVRPDDGLMGSHQKHFYGMLGYRATRVTSDGYEPFSTRPVLHQFSVLFGRVLFAEDALSVALGAGWDYGASDADARDAATQLNVHRLSLVPELRYHFARRLYAFGRLGVGISFVHATLGDAVTASERTSDRVAFSIDPSVGAAFELVGEPAGASKQPRVWAVLDGGYLFTTATKTALAHESGAPSRADDHTFAELGLSGLTGRLSIALTF